jgi:hypothetical protein
VKYENLVNKPSQTIRSIFEKLNEDLPRSVLDFAESNVNTNSIMKMDLHRKITENVAKEMLISLEYMPND